ncbi:MAG: hypothetical protein E3K32_02935 [wastewater metagenome]|nr:hypothetical protein [Candidatus Loosdrechtia aerotolerans]
MSLSIIEFIKKLSGKYRQALTDLVDFLAILNFRGKKLQDNQSIINATLQAACKKAIVNRLYGGAALLLSIALCLLVAGVIATPVLLRFPFGLFIFYTGSLLALFFVFVKVVFLPLLSLLNREKIALFMEERYPSLNNSLISSVQLTKGTLQKRGVTYSEQMIGMLVEDTANQVKQLDINRVINRGFLRFTCVILIASFVIFSTVYIYNHSSFHKNIPLLFSYFSKGEGVVEKGFAAYSGPVIGDITLAYRYPLYTGLSPKTIYNTSGDIKALKGSEVQISALSDRPLLSAEMILNDSKRIPLEIENGRMFKGNLLLFESGSYCFETTDSNGRVVKDTVLHTIQVDPDQFPEISIRSPGKDLIVNEKDTVELTYAARDDFGIHEITLVFERGGEKKTETLMRSGKKRTEYNGSYLWSLSELNLREEERIAYHLEVKDNDTISEQKVGSSRVYYLEVYSSRKKHQDLIQLQEALLREMLFLLSDDLTKRVDDEKCTSKDYLMMIQDGVQGYVKKIHDLFTDILVGMQDDTLANYSVYYALQNLKEKFHTVTDKKQTAVMRSVQDTAESSMPVSVLQELQKTQDEEVAEVENIILFINEMIEKQRLEDVLDTGKNLVQSQNTIEKLLNSLREGKDEKLNEKVLAELMRIEDTLQQMMEKLMKMAQGEHMDEFLNADAMKTIEQNSLMEELNAMKDALSKGDLDSALQAAQRLLSELQKMMDQMGSSAQNFADQSFGDMLKDANHLTDKISGLESKERELAENTDQLKKEIQSRTSQAMNETLKSFFEKQGERLDTMKRDLAESKEILAENGLVQRYLQVNRDLKRMSEEREAMTGRLNELFGSQEDVNQFQRESEKLAELFRENAELNREINRDPMQRSLLNMSRDLPQIEEKIPYLEELLKGWEAKESLDLAEDVLQDLGRLNDRIQNVLRQKEASQAEIPKEDLEVSEKVNDAADQNQQIVNDLKAIMQSLEEQALSGLTEDDRNAMQEYAQKQKELQEEAEELAELADQLSRQNPFMDENADNQLDMASQSMGEAKEKLEKHDAEGAALDERESLYRLAQARKGMEMAKERIAKGMMGGGMPMPMPGPFRGRMDEGQFGTSAEKVEIPSEEAYKVPKEFREDILNALKEGLPEKYRALNRDYYQRLVD